MAALTYTGGDFHEMRGVRRQDDPLRLVPQAAGADLRAMQDHQDGAPVEAKGEGKESIDG